MVFISHKTEEDHEKAIQIASILKDNGVSCWYAPESIQPGKDYVKEIVNALITCEYFLLILTPSTEEIEIAQELEKPFLVLQAKDYRMSYEYSYLLCDCQFMQFNWDAPNYEELIERCKRGERVVTMNVSRYPKRNITIMRGDYQENMDSIIENHPDILPNTVFALGIDRSADLKISSNKGIIKWVCKYLLEKYGVSIDKLQSLVDDAIKEKNLSAENGFPLKYEDTVLITVQVKTDVAIHLLLIANSQKQHTFSVTGNVDEVEGIDSRKIINAVFSSCVEHGIQAQNLVIGAMGTNGLLFPYEIATAEIMSCFAYSQRMGIMPLNLVYSVREADMKLHGLTTDMILSYISKTIDFFKDKRQ